jgi:hypothetical protein
MLMIALMEPPTSSDTRTPIVISLCQGEGVDKARKQWKKLKGKYLFNEFALANVFRARFLSAMKDAALNIPMHVPEKWVVDCKHIGSGEPALKYLSRYLYRDGEVTFSYIDSDTDQTQYRTLKGEDFIWLVIQHVLPKGFRRIRDYGFPHGNARKLLSLVQLILHVMISAVPIREQPRFKCPRCESPLQIIGFIKPAWQSG